jgi:hypothetical protein
MFQVTAGAQVNLSALGRRLLNTLGDIPSTFEATAQQICQIVQREIVTPDGQPLFALVRIYRLTRPDEMPTDLRALAGGEVGYSMTLMGSAGVEPAWNSRHTSTGHKVVPMTTDTSLMMRAAVRQLALDVGVEMPLPPSVTPEMTDEPIVRVFYVAQAAGSPLIPAQDFVRDYGIQSVIGLGSGFVSRSAFFMPMFSRLPIDRAMIDGFAMLTSFVGALLAQYDQPDLLWSAHAAQ